MAPNRVPAATPSANPEATRSAVARACRASSPEPARSASVARMTEGGGTTRPSDNPAPTMTYQASASPTGKAGLMSGRANRACRSGGARSSETVGSAETVTLPRDMAITQMQRGAALNHGRPPGAAASAGNRGARAPRGSAAPAALARVRHLGDLRSISGERDAVVDQVVDGGLDVDIGGDDARLLQRNAGR